MNQASQFRLFIVFFTIIISTNKLSAQEVLPSKTLLKDGNISVIFSDGTVKQLTYNGTDIEAFLIAEKGEVIFVRQEEVGGGNGNYITHKIMKVNIKSLIEEVITENKPYLDGNDATSEILSVGYPTLSIDKNFIYFITEKYVTGSEFVKVNLQTGKWTELFSAESFHLLESGQFKGLFLVAVSEVGSRGRDIYYKLCDELGTVKKEFESYENMIKFMNDIK